MLFLLFAILQTPAAPIQAADTLPLRLRINRQAIPLQLGKLCEVKAGAGLHYAGGRRFILKSVADAEQHFFLAADAKGEIQRLYWLQAEELLPDARGGYDYTSDSARTINGLSWWASLRDMNGPVQPGSDRAAMVRFLEQRGYHLPLMAPRLRLVYVPEPLGRREFMVVYLESAASAAADTGFAATVARATRGLQFKRCG